MERRKIKVRPPDNNGFGRNIPPSLLFVKIYFDQKGSGSSEAERFYQYYSTNGWTTPTGNKISNWKAEANNWIWDNHQNLIM